VTTTRNMFIAIVRDMYSKHCALDKKLRHRLMSWRKHDWTRSLKTALLELPIFSGVDVQIRISVQNILVFSVPQVKNYYCKTT